MKIYESKNMANMASIVLVLSAVIGVVITFLFFQKYWYVLVLFITPLLLISLIMPELMSSLYSIKDGYLIKQMDKKHLNDPLKTYTIDKDGKRDYKATIFSIKLTEIIKIKKHKNLFGYPFISVYYNENNAIDIYLKVGEMDEFINEISEKKDPSV